MSRFLVGTIMFWLSVLLCETSENNCPPLGKCREPGLGQGVMTFLSQGAGPVKGMWKWGTEGQGDEGQGGKRYVFKLLGKELSKGGKLSSYIMSGVAVHVN